MSDEELMENTDWSADSIKLLRSALNPEMLELDKLDEHENSSEDLIMKAEFSQELNKRLSEKLTTDEQIMVFMLFQEEMTQVECGNFFGISQQAFSKREKKLLEKVSSIVAEMQQP